jgi:transposase
LLRVVADPSEKRLPELVCACLVALGRQLLSLKKQILEFDRMIPAWHRSNQTSKRLNCIPGVGPLLATALSRALVIRKACYKKAAPPATNTRLGMCARLTA